jgi:hypothetical protein
MEDDVNQLIGRIVISRARICMQWHVFFFL